MQVLQDQPQGMEAFEKEAAPKAVCRHRARNSLSVLPVSKPPEKQIPLWVRIILYGADLPGCDREAEQRDVFFCEYCQR